MAQKEEVLSKVNQICEERNFDLSETFRDKFSEKFAEAYKDAPIEDDGLVAALNISVESSGHARKNAFSEATKGFEAKEAEYKSQIEEWKKKAEKGNQEPPKFELPAEYKEKLDRLEKFELQEKTKSVRNQIYDTAKSKVREDLHESFRNYLGKQNIAIDADINAEAERLLKDYQDIFRSSIGDITPLSPAGKKTTMEDYLDAIKPVKL